MVEFAVCPLSTLLSLLVVGSTAIHAGPVNSKTLSRTEALEGGTTDIRQGFISAHAVSSAMKEFQKVGGLTPKGELDEDTLQKKITPYCGVKDDIEPNNSTGNKRPSRQVSRWAKRHLTYIILNYPSNLRLSTVKSEIARAFKVWSDQVDLTFTPARNVHDADFTFEFVRMDGPGKLVGFGSFPPIGEVQFDIAEHWTVNSREGVNLFQTAVHEIGHALGLTHSWYKAAVMWEETTPYQPNFRLHKDDIIAIRRLYGPKNRPYRPRG